MRDPDRYGGVPIDDIFPTEVHPVMRDEEDDYGWEYRGPRWANSLFPGWDLANWYYFPPL